MAEKDMCAENELYGTRPGVRGNRLKVGKSHVGGYWMSQRTSAFKMGIISNQSPLRGVQLQGAVSAASLRQPRYVSAPAKVCDLYP